MRPRFYHYILFLLLFIATGPLVAGEKVFGDYTIHYSAFNADFLSPAVAKAYGIQRSRNRGVLNVTLLKKIDGGLPQAVKGEVKGSAVTVYQKARPLELREVVDQDSVYYIAEFPVADEETLNFRIEASTGGKDIGTVSFQQQFFVR